MIAYKFLRGDGSSVFTAFSWPQPAAGPGAWVEAPLDPCRSGIHACRASDLPHWAGRALYRVELDGDVVVDATKVMASRGRLVGRIAAWDDQRDEYTRMCADRAHELAREGGPALEQWEAVVERSVPDGPALLGFIAAAIAEKVAGDSGGYRAERALQAEWLAERLGLAA